MVSDKRCVMCETKVMENMAHFMEDCGEFERDRLVLLDGVCRIMGGIEWLDEFCRVAEEGRLASMLEKVLEGICKSDGGYWRVHIVLVR